MKYAITKGILLMAAICFAYADSGNRMTCMTTESGEGEEIRKKTYNMSCSMAGEGSPMQLGALKKQITSAMRRKISQEIEAKMNDMKPKKMMQGVVNRLEKKLSLKIGVQIARIEKSLWQKTRKEIANLRTEMMKKMKSISKGGPGSMKGKSKGGSGSMKGRSKDGSGPRDLCTVKYSKKCYWIYFNDSMSYQAAERACEQNGSELGNVHNERHFQMLTRAARKLMPTRYGLIELWTGMMKDNATGIVALSDESPAYDIKWGQPITSRGAGPNLPSPSPTSQAHYALLMRVPQFVGDFAENVGFTTEARLNGGVLCQREI